ncbi:Terminal EAR1-like, RNA recognition motif 3 [Sesbania bispinosa]|nr:Terminal EAR1-like, RNA recognition motif 3 [Sesbania bispinosa]
MKNLDPTAEEFRPRNPNHGAPTTPFPHPYAFPYGAFETVSFYYGEAVVPVPYPHTQLSSPPALVAPSPASPPTPLSTSSTRSLLLSVVPSETVISESTLRRELEVFGDVRGIQMENLREGTVTVHFYDLRHAETALTAIRWQQHHTRLRNHHYAPFNSTTRIPARGLIAVWAQYILPARDGVPDGQNQGTIVVFNLDSEMDAESIREIFEAFGPVKEIRHTPSKKNQRFVEFFDIRDAAKALKQMNGKEIHGKPVVVEFSRPGGHGRKFFNVAAASSTISKSKSLPYSPSPPPLPRRFWPSFVPDAAASHFSQRQLSSSKKTLTISMNLGEEIRNGDEDERHHSHSHSHVPAPKRNSVRKHVSESTVESTKHQQQPVPRSRNWRGKQAKKHETRFLIKEDAATAESGCIDSRTTVMIKNIPNKYSQKLLLNMLDNHCIHCNEQIGDGDDQILSSYDFVYLPIDFNNKCNVGYGFVNMTTPEATLRLYKAFHLQPWEVFNSRKICEVTYARVQGLEALKEHFKNSKFPYEMEQYLPVVFSPPRDGKQLTEPLPIGNNKSISMTIPIGLGASDDLLSSSSNRQNGSVEEGDDDHHVDGVSE